MPHSRQERFARGVINPQNGHILCVPIWGPSVLRILNSFRMKSTVEASRLRKVGRYGSIDLPPVLILRHSNHPTNDAADSVPDCSQSGGVRSAACRIKPEVSYSDQLLFSARAMMTLEVSTSSLSFRSSGLSQLSEAFSS